MKRTHEDGGEGHFHPLMFSFISDQTQPGGGGRGSESSGVTGSSRVNEEGSVLFPYTHTHARTHTFAEKIHQAVVRIPLTVKAKAFLVVIGVPERDATHHDTSHAPANLHAPKCSVAITPLRVLAQKYLTLQPLSPSFNKNQ